MFAHSTPFPVTPLLPRTPSAASLDAALRVDGGAQAPEGGPARVQGASAGPGGRREGAGVGVTQREFRSPGVHVRVPELQTRCVQEPRLPGRGDDMLYA